MNHVIIAAVMFTHIFNLGMTVVAGCDHVIGAGGHDLIKLDFAIRPALVRITALKGAAAAAATEVIGTVGDHFDVILLAHHRFDHEPQVVDDLVRTGFAPDITGVLNGESGFDILVPVGIDLEGAVFDPFGIQFDNGRKLERMGNLIFSQSFQD